MKLEDQVCSYEQAKKLKKMIGILEHHYSWYEISRCSNLHETIVPVLHRKGEFWEGYVSKIAEYPAYTVAELFYLLPEEILGKYETGLIISKDKELYQVWYWNVPYDYHLLDIDGESLPQILADALIWLIDNGYVNPKELKL